MLSGKSNITKDQQEEEECSFVTASDTKENSALLLRSEGNDSINFILVSDVTNHCVSKIWKNLLIMSML